MANDLKSSAVRRKSNVQKDVLDYTEDDRIEDVEICAKCKGRCCKNAPCHYSPDDFKNLSYRALKSIIARKKYISIVRIKLDFNIDNFSTKEYYYVLRIRRKDTPIAVDMDQKYKDKRCMLLKKDGCVLPYEKRPKGARMLVPRQNSKCIQLYNLRECVRDWLPYQSVLRKLYRYFNRKFLIQNLFYQSEI